MNGVNNSLAGAAGNGLTEAIKWSLEAGANPNTPESVSLLSFLSHHHCELLDFEASIIQT